MRFAAPWLLLLIPLVAWYARRRHQRSFVDPSRAMLVARIALFTVLIIALARPEISLPSGSVERLALVDGSASILPSRREATKAIVKELGAANPGMEVWRFGAGTERASVAEPLGKTPQVET